MLKPNAIIALVVTILILGAFVALCVFVRCLSDPYYDGNDDDSDASSMYYVSTSTSRGGPGVAAAAAGEPVAFPPGVRVSDRRLWDSLARESRRGNGEGGAGSGDRGSGGNDSGNGGVGGSRVQGTGDRTA